MLPSYTFDQFGFKMCARDVSTQTVDAIKNCGLTTQTYMGFIWYIDTFSLNTHINIFLKCMRVRVHMYIHINMYISTFYIETHTYIYIYI